ncbi:MAG TPA: tetratricopeptide repeat protein, partial [Kofleriaceae bacterium]|nr:tetratricopeptide repeat protein [Kofleriaceae bacterium]
DVDALRATGRLPEDPAARTRVAELARAIDEIEALQATGRNQDALTRMQALLPRVEAVAHPPLLAEALDLEHQIQAWLGLRRESAATLDRAMRAAAQAGDDRRAAEIAISRLYVHVHLLGETAKADELIGAAETAVLRAGGSDELQLRLASQTGLALLTLERYDEAVAELARAAALGERVYGHDALEQGHVLANQALVLDAAGKYADARAVHERALAIQERGLGPDHPAVANTLQNLGINLRTQGQLDRAIEVSTRALRIVERAYAPDSADLAVASESLGLVYMVAQRPAEGRPYLERALAIREKHPDDADLPKTLHNLALLLTDLHEYAAARRHLERSIALKTAQHGEEGSGLASAEYALGDLISRQAGCREALPHFQRSLALGEKGLGPDHPNLAYPLQGIGHCERELGRPARAVSPLERAVALTEKAGASPVDIAAYEFQLAGALWEAGADRGRAVAVARRARAGYAHAPTDQAKAVAEIDRWLATHR